MAGNQQPSQTTYTLDAAYLICEGPVTLLKVWADSDLIIDYSAGPYYAPFVNASMFAFHNGWSDPGTVHSIQLPDSTIVGSLGTGNVPAYTNRAVFVVNAFPWSRYGHTPNFSFLVQSGTGVTLDTILANLFNRVGVASSDYDFSAVAGITVDGFLIPGLTDLASAIKPLCDAYHFDIVEVDGVIKSVLRTVGSSFTLDPKWVGVSTDGDPPEVAIEPTRRLESELPRSINVTFASAARDYQVADQTVRRITTQSQNQDTLSLPIVLSDTAGRRIGESYLYERWMQRTSYKITYPLNYLGIAPGDIGILPVNGVNKTVRVLEQTMGLFGHIEATVRDHDPSIYTQIASGDGFGQGSVLQGSGSLTAFLLDTNAPTDGLVYTGSGGEQVLIGTSIARAGTQWRTGGVQPASGVSIYNPTGTKYRTDAKAVTLSSPSTIGTVSSALPVASSLVVDVTSTLTVTLVFGTLTSCTDTDFLRGATNLAMVGSEMIQFRDAVQVTAGVYTISHLMRGKRGTEASISGHAGGEGFALISTSRYIPASAALTGNPTTANFTAQEAGTDPSSIITINAVPMLANNLKMYAPCNIAATRDGSNNITLTWTRRSRYLGSDPWTVGLDNKDNAGRPYEIYSIDVLVASVVVGTYTVIVQSAGVTYLGGLPSVVISAATQTVIGGGILNPITVKIYQLNYSAPLNNGRGYPGAATV